MIKGCLKEAFVYDIMKLRLVFLFFFCFFFSFSTLGLSLELPHGDEVLHAPVLPDPGRVRPRGLDEAQPLEGVVAGLRARYAHDGAVALLVVGDGLAGRAEERLVHLRVHAPRRAAVAEDLAGGELEADEAALVVEELAHALGPLRAEVGRQGAQELAVSHVRKADTNATS